MNLPDHYPKRPTYIFQKNDFSGARPGEEEADPSKKDFLSSYEFVMVFPMEADFTTQTKEARHCIHEMLQAGLEVFPYKSIQNDELMVLIRCPLPVLRRFADAIDYKLKVNPEELRKRVEAGDPEKRIKGVKLNDDSEICKYGPYDHVYLKYEEDIHEIYERNGEDGLGTDPFIKSVRLKVIYELLRAPKHQGGCALELSKLLHKRRILAMYPLHEYDVLKRIEEKCLDKWVMPWDMPVLDIREYFGEKIALYNVFLGHYSTWLFTPSIIGLAFQLVVWGTLDFSHPVLPFYSLVVTVWSIFMLEYWKRHESATAMRWGMSDFEQLESERPEYYGDSITSPINGRKMTFNPPTVTRRMMAITQTVVSCFIAIVIGVVAAIYVFRFFLQKQSNGTTYASTVASIINTVQIMIFNTIYQQVATKLTDIENHRTDTQYEDSLIAKLFVFQFVNSYASFFFLAFIASNLDRPDNVSSDYIGQCGATNCMQPLSINLAFIFGSRLTITNLLDIAVPYYMHKRNIKKESEGVDEAVKANTTPAEHQYYLMQFRPMVEGLQNYADTAVQYGFTLLFITALPCASFFSLLNNYVKTKFTAWKLCKLYQRPIPRGAQDIGSWQTILAILSVASVITNAALVCFTMDVLWGYSLQGRVWIFIGFQWVLIAIQYITQAVIPDVPEGVLLQEQRVQFFEEKIINKVEDEDYDDVYEEDSEVAEEPVHDVRGRCCGVKMRSRIKKIRGDKPPVVALEYPHNPIAGVWPEPLSNKYNPSQQPRQDDASVASGPAVVTVSEFSALPPPPPA